MGLGKTKIDVRAERLQRQPSLQVPFLARDFRAVQTAGDTNLDSLASETQGRVHRLAHGAAEGHALFELQRNRFGDELRLQFRPVDFLDVNVNFAFRALLDFTLELVDFRALAPDDDSRTGRKQANHELVGGAFDVDRTDSGGTQFVLQLLAQRNVLVQQVGIIAVRVPARFPGLVVPQPEPVWMCLLSQSFLPLLPGLPGRLFPSGKRLASLLHRALDALLRFRFHRGGGDALLYGVVMFEDADHDVARPALIPERAAHGGRTQPLPARALVHKAARNKEMIDIERCARVFGLALRVGNGTAQNFLNIARRALLGEAQNLKGILGALPADQVHHQADFLGRHAHVARHRHGLNRRCEYRFVCHQLSLWRSRCAAPCRCRATRGRPRCPWSAGNTRRPLERRLHGVAFERARRRKLSELVPNHLFGDVDRNKFSAVVDGNRVPDHVGKDRRTARPSLDDFLFVTRVHSLHLFAKVVIDEWALLERACHRFSLLLTYFWRAPRPGLAGVFSVKVEPAQ